MTKARDIITSAFRKAGIIARGQVLTDAEMQDALDDLNGLIEAFGNEALTVPYRVREVFTLTSGKATYTIGAGGDFDTVRPNYINSAFVRDGTTDWSLEVISEESYDSVKVKNTTAIPQFLTFNNGTPLAVITLYKTPSTGYELHILSEKNLSEFLTLDTDVSLPNGWRMMIIYNLAVLLCAEYQLDPPQATAQFAMQFKKNIKTQVARSIKVTWDIGDGIGDVYAGWWR